jgi:hypothetical protein
VLRLDPDSEITMHGLAINHPPTSVSADIGVARAAAKQNVSQRAVPPRGARIASKLAWCTAGFLIGAAFWHLVGFWSFVSYVVLGGPTPQVSFASARPLTVASAVQASVPAKPAIGGRPSCITLALDRSTGKTRPEPCDAAATPLPHVAASPREDLALLPDQSSPTISPYSAPGPTAPSQAD